MRKRRVWCKLAPLPLYIFRFLCILFCFLGVQVIALFRRKISLGHFTEALVADALQGRAGALHGLFHSLLGITDALVGTGLRGRSLPSSARAVCSCLQWYVRIGQYYSITMYCVQRGFRVLVLFFSVNTHLTAVS